MAPADGMFSSLPIPQCPIKISDRKKEITARSLGCQNIYQQNEKQCGHLSYAQDFCSSCQKEARNVPL